jgi:hypothetical protein
MEMARALIDAGHEVSVTTAEAFRPVVEDAGLELIPAGISDTEAFERLIERFPQLPGVTPPERVGRSCPGCLSMPTCPRCSRCRADPCLGPRHRGQRGG